MGWIANVLRPHLIDVIVFDPLRNTWMRRGSNQEYITDAIKLYRLPRFE